MMKPELKVFCQFLKAQDTLKNYTPADHHFTSEEEIEKISTALGLHGLSVSEMSLMRSFVVLYYEYLRSELSRNDDQWENYWEGMMSVVAVIDHISHGATA